MAHTQTIALRLGIVLALAASLLLPAGAGAHSHKHKGLEIVHPWCFAGGDPGRTGLAIYMVIRNTTKRADRLIGATAAGGQKIELRQSASGASGGQSHSAPGLVIGAGQELVLRSGGPHLLLTGVEKPYEPYDAFFVTLIFERAGKVEIEVAVEEAPAARHR